MVSMTFSERFLVVVLAAALAVFLLLAIVALVKVNQILKHIRHITEKAEKLTDHAEAVGEFFQKTAGPTAIAKLLSNIVHSFRTSKAKKD